MAWYRVYKIFRNGQSPIGYFEVPKHTKKFEVEEYAKKWAEHTDGGHNYGWTVYWTRAKRPSKKWLERKIKSLSTNIGYYKRTLKDYQAIHNKI